MSEPIDFFGTPQGRVYARALDARDARFDGVFFVGITTTRIYCRPVCPARVAHQSHRRFFAAAAAAEQAGYRPCLRCRPELAPGRASCDAISRLAATAEQRIAAGALNGHSVAKLARELGVSERHLRRVLKRALGVSPAKLAQSHRLLFAKRLLVDTTLPVTQVAFASGFQSLRRFNASFVEQYRMPPSAVRRVPRAANSGRGARAQPSQDYLRLTLAYRAPLAWEVLVACLAGDGVAGVEVIDGQRYGRTVEIAGRTGVVFAANASTTTARRQLAHLNVDISASLVPALMPLLARFRQLFDLDAEPSAIDAHLSQSGLRALVSAHPGIRLPGAIDGFDIALRALLRGRVRVGRATAVGASGPFSTDVAARVAWDIGEVLETGVASLARLSPTAARVADAGSGRLVALGVPRARAERAVTIAQLVANGALRLEAGGDVAETYRAIAAIRGVGDQVATMLVSRALRWPDALPVGDAALQRAAQLFTPRRLLLESQRWRPWRGYAALHLWLHDESHQHVRAARRDARAVAHPHSERESSCLNGTHASLAS